MTWISWSRGAFQVEVFGFETQHRGGKTQNIFGKGKYQQSRLEGWGKGGDSKKPGGEKQLKALQFCP